MKNLFIIFLLLFSQPAGSQWYLQEIDPAVNLFDVRFINRYTGWVCGDNRIFKTTNAGMNWVEQSNPAQSLLWQIHPVNENVVYAAGYCTILKTTNGGDNWLPLRNGSLPCPGQNYTGLWFMNEQTGWFCGLQIGLRTTDGGNTFVDSVNINYSMYDITFFDDSTGVMAGFGGTLRTTNSGVSWYEVKLPHFAKSPDVYRMSFLENIGWCGTLSNKVYKTMDFGVSWDSITLIQANSGNNRTHCVEFPSGMIGYAGCTQGKIYKSTDGGLSWNLHPTSVYGIPIYRAIYAYDDNVVWAVGRGKILHTANGGLTDTRQHSQFIPTGNKLHQNFPNPFNPGTSLRFDISKSAQVRLLIYDMTGKLVTCLLDKKMNPGSYETGFNAGSLSSGYYLCVLEVDGKASESRKLAFLK